MKQSTNLDLLKKAKAFLETIPAEDFIANEQTLHFDPKYVGKKHCVYGHLFVNPNSPFYNTANGAVVATNLSMLNDSAKQLHDILQGIAYFYPIVEVNNKASDANRKAAVLQEIDNMIAKYAQVRAEN